MVSVDVAEGTAVTFDSYGKAIKHKDEKLIKKKNQTISMNGKQNMVKEMTSLEGNMSML